MSELQVQDALYQPGKFWREASKDMLEELSQHGISSFRHLKTSQNFFAPTYGVPGNALTEAQVEQLKQTIEEQSSSKQRDNPNTKKQTIKTNIMKINENEKD
jgi:hypothetical protein